MNKLSEQLKTLIEFMQNGMVEYEPCNNLYRYADKYLASLIDIYNFNNLSGMGICRWDVNGNMLQPIVSTNNISVVEGWVYPEIDNYEEVFPAGVLPGHFIKNNNIYCAQQNNINQFNMFQGVTQPPHAYKTYENTFMGNINAQPMTMNIGKSDTDKMIRSIFTRLEVLENYMRDDINTPTTSKVVTCDIIKRSRVNVVNTGIKTVDYSTEKEKERWGFFVSDGPIMMHLDNIVIRTYKNYIDGSDIPGDIISENINTIGLNYRLIEDLSKLIYEILTDHEACTRFAEYKGLDIDGEVIVFKDKIINYKYMLDLVEKYSGVDLENTYMDHENLVQHMINAYSNYIGTLKDPADIALNRLIFAAVLAAYVHATGFDNVKIAVSRILNDAVHKYVLVKADIQRDVLIFKHIMDHRGNFTVKSLGIHSVKLLSSDAKFDPELMDALISLALK